MKVAIIGNGFDIRRGLKTQYIDFINKYFTKEDGSIITRENLILQYLILSKNNRSWVDLENDLLCFLEDLSSLNSNLSYDKESDIDIIDRSEFCKSIQRMLLFEALQKVSHKIDGMHAVRDKIVVFFDWYDNLIKKVIDDYKIIKKLLVEYLKDIEKNAIISKNEFNEIKVLQVADRVFTFNYTNIAENYSKGKIHYVHGSLRDKIILGVPFSTKVSIKEFHKLFKISQSIQMEKNRLIYDNLREKLELYFMGFSFGQSDHYFFQEIKDWIAKYTLNDYTKMPPIYFNFYYHEEEAISDYLYNLRVFLGEEMLTRFDLGKNIKFIPYD